MRILKQILGILATGYILFFHSEVMFWARLRPEDSLGNGVSTWLLYSLMAYIFLTILARFQVFTVWALFLAGAVFGWLTEGLVVQTAYESLPLSISFTGLAWHALITVCVGWYAVRRALHSGLRSILLWGAGIGLAYGFWAISWWLEPDGGMAAPFDFAKYAFSSSLLLILAYLIHDCTVPGVFKPNRTVEIVIAILLLIYFMLVTIPAAPISAVLLPVLLAGIYLTLRQNQWTETGGSLLDSLAGAKNPWHYLALLVLPLTASAFYWVAFSLGFRWHTNWVLYLVTTPAGFILLVISLVKVWSRKPSSGGFVESADR